jgi:hypothetical protein
MSYLKTKCPIQKQGVLLKNYWKWNVPLKN